jgi:ABC-type dipeptide/oligopeptide/nickel transport system permease component
MAAYILKRILSSLVVMWAVATLVFLGMRLIPADPAAVVLGDYASEEALSAFRRQMGLDQPLFTQYMNFITGILQGDLGNSMITGRPIANQIWAVFPFTLQLAIASMLVGAIIGIPLGIVTALRRNTWIDYLGRFLALCGFSFPAFYLGVILLLVFSVQFGWFPITHNPRGGDIGRHLYLLVLPTLSLGLIQASFVTRLTRSTMLENLSADYVRTAYAKGLSHWVVNYKHVLKNIMIPVITAMGLYTGSILGGAILTETVFNRPGVGRLLVGAIAQRDYNLIQVGIMLFALIIVIVNLLVDLAYSLFDPRVRYE